MKTFEMNNPCICVPKDGSYSACAEISGKCPHQVLHEHSPVCKSICYGVKCVAVEVYICSYSEHCGVDNNHDMSNKKLCGHRAPHIKREDCGMGCYIDNYDSSRCKILWSPTPSVEGLPINRVIISKDTPKATRYHMRKGTRIYSR